MSITENAKSDQKLQRVRSRAQWAFIIGGVGLCATCIGIFQFLFMGEVFIRTYYEPQEGSEALASLTYLLIISLAFIGYGYLLRRRFKRHGAT